MANVKFPSGKPSDSNGLTKRGVDGSSESNFSNQGGDKGAKAIGPKTLTRYRTKVSALNTGEINARGSATNIADRNDI